MTGDINIMPLGGSNPQSQMHSEYEDVIQALMKSFPEKTELEIEQALSGYIETTGNKSPSEMDSKLMLEHITKTFNIQLSTEAASEIKKEWEELTKSMDVSVSDLASVLSSYSSDGIDKTDRNFLMLLWQKLQSELEEAVVDESSTTAISNKEMQQKEFNEYVDKKAEEMKKAGSTNFWNKLLKWGGVVASLIGAVAACAVAAVAIATGVGAPAGALLIAAAVIMVGLAVAGTVSAVLDECGIEWQLGQGLGKGIAKLLTAMGADIDEEAFAKWTAIAVQITLTVVAIVCSFGAGAISSVGSLASAGVNTAKVGAETVSKTVQTLSTISNGLKMLSAGAGIATGVTQGVAAVNNYQLATMQAALLELKALLAQLAETRNMDQELTASILSKIFEAMRGNVADSTDTIIQDMELIAGMTLNKA